MKNSSYTHTRVHTRATAHHDYSWTSSTTDAHNDTIASEISSVSSFRQQPYNTVVSTNSRHIVDHSIMREPEMPCQTRSFSHVILTNYFWNPAAEAASRQSIVRVKHIGDWSAYHVRPTDACFHVSFVLFFLTWRHGNNQRKSCVKSMDVTDLAHVYVKIHKHQWSDSALY